MSEIKLSTDKHDIDDLIRYLDGDHHMSVFDRAQVVKDLKAQLPKPVVKEPTAFGSILRANCEPGLRGIFWQKSPMHGKHYWESTGGALALWSELTEVEVLRVGIGEPPPLTDEEIDKQAAEAQRIIHAVNSVAAGEIVRPNHQLAAYYDEMNRLDVASADTDAYAQGRDDFALALRKQLADLQRTVITAPEKRVADQALKLIAAALGES